MKRSPNLALSALIAGVLAAAPFLIMLAVIPAEDNALYRLHWPFVDARVTGKTALDRACRRARDGQAQAYTVAFVPPGETAERQAEFVLWSRDCGAYREGDALQIRVDPADPSRVLTRLQAGFPFGFTPLRVALAVALFFAVFVVFVHVVRRDAFR